MMDELNIFIQEYLNREKGYNLVVDGLIGPATLGAIGRVFDIPDGWSNDRKVVGAVQWACYEYDLDFGGVDGYFGPQTMFAFENLKNLLENGKLVENWRDDVSVTTKNKWPKQNTDDFDKYFGVMGENLVNFEPPYPHYWSWDNSKPISTFKCHKKVSKSLKKVLTAVNKHYGPEKIKELHLDQLGGCFHIRHIRGGSTWSTHSWGISLDYYPPENQLRWGDDKALFAKTEYLAWWECWEAEGWVSLGRELNFDWMHVQAANL